MKLTPDKCLEKWRGKKIIVGIGEEGCTLALDEKINVGKGTLDTRIIGFGEAREILVALIHKQKTREMVI